MGLQDRDYMRSKHESAGKRDYFKGPHGFVLQVLATVASFAVGCIMAARLLGWFGLMSLPWVQGGGLYLVYGVIPLEIIGVLASIVWIFYCLFVKGASRAVGCFAISVAIVAIVPALMVPNLSDVLFWRGPAGEFLQSRVISRETGFQPLDPAIAKADGSLVWLQNSKVASNPSWLQLQEFLRSDGTDKFPYRPGKFVCADFAELLHNTAEASGLRCGYVLVELDDGESHALNVFDTSDHGLIFIDCTGSTEAGGPDNHDRRVVVKAGWKYKPEYIFTDDWTVQTMGVVRSMQVHW